MCPDYNKCPIVDAVMVMMQPLPSALLLLREYSSIASVLSNCL
jgi:hypothetical protein